MPRYRGPSRGLKHSVETLLDDDAFARLSACRAQRGENQAEFVRQAILFFLLTKCLSNPTESIVQPIDEGSAQ